MPKGLGNNDLMLRWNGIKYHQVTSVFTRVNPIEQVWSWLRRQHHLANLSFKGYEDIVDACSIAWNSLISDTKRVMSLCRRDWAIMT
ncbi:hypothetical protein Sps_01197 [Shewanella psychrophila]|uniref:DDE superfamily endonuclease n=1 Tax=Shewanella psychrophila TaxID=225848 RepID=A0A1S6HLJ3_9GAMM|nr:hypothetical protein Sps_01197 [Shewanella psychrophila]